MNKRWAQFKAALRAEPATRALCTKTNAIILACGALVTIALAPVVSNAILLAICVIIPTWALIVITSSREIFLHWQATIHSQKSDSLIRMQNEEVFVAWMLQHVRDARQTGLAEGRITIHEASEAERYTFARHNAKYHLWKLSEKLWVQCLMTTLLWAFVVIAYPFLRRFGRNMRS